MKNKRKAIVLSASILGSIAVVSSGFAAWVITAPSAQSTSEGNISVDGVQDHSITITATSDNATVVYGWEDEKTFDQTNAWLTNNDENYKEKLTVEFVVTVTNISFLSDEGITYVVTATEGYGSCGNLVGELPSGQIEKTAFTINENENKGTYNLTLVFKWGEYFKVGEQVVNPIRYYNSKEYSAEVAADAQAKLETLKNNLETAKYTLTLDVAA